MDRSAPVDEKTPSTKSGFVEQAIFTSIRSPMGQGYQIVAASPGLSGDEKKEIVQCAPSHGSLCDPSSTAVGLASFELRSGRRCLFLSRNAGIEPTARGGYRICTHVLVMEPALFRTFQCNPLRVEAAARAAIGLDLSPTAPARLDSVVLRDETGQSVGRPLDGVPPPRAADADRAIHLLSAILCGRRVLVVGAPAAHRSLRWLLGATPTAVRWRLSLSYGLKFSPSRGFQLVLADGDHRETQRVARDHDIEVFCWETPTALADSPFDAWLRLVHRHWESDRHIELDRLAGQLTEENNAAALERIATLWADTERAKQADAPLLDRLIQRHSCTTPISPGHRSLLGRFQKAARMRKEALALAAQDPPVDDEPLIIGLA